MGNKRIWYVGRFVDGEELGITGENNAGYTKVEGTVHLNHVLG